MWRWTTSETQHNPSGNTNRTNRTVWAQVSHHNAEVSCSVSSLPDLLWHGSMDWSFVVAGKRRKKISLESLVEALRPIVRDTNCFCCLRWNTEWPALLDPRLQPRIDSWRVQEWSGRPGRGLKGWMGLFGGRIVPESEATGAVRGLGQGQGSESQSRSCLWKVTFLQNFWPESDVGGTSIPLKSITMIRCRTPVNRWNRSTTQWMCACGWFCLQHSTANVVQVHVNWMISGGLGESALPYH